MPDGSLRPLGPPPSSTSHISTIDTSSSSSLRSFPLAIRKVRPKTAVDDSMKAKIFGSAPASPTSARPKTGNQSVRGRISGPFPIPNPLEDDEFPIRNPGTSVASSTPLDSSDIHPPPTVPPALPSPVAVSFAAPPPPPPPVSQTLTESAMMEMVDVPQIPQTVPEHPGTPTTRPPGSTTGLPSSGPSPESAVSNVSGTQSSAKLHRANPSSSARYSMISATSEAGGSTGSQNGPPQRKRSTLRSAIGRLLRRKKRDGSLSSVKESERQVAMGERQEQQQAPQQQHRSVPPAMRAIPDQDLQPGKRVTSMPISEFDRALRSHSIGPDDITAIESARNSIDALGSSMSRLRAVSGIQDRIFIPRSRGEDWEGLSPRPASTHARSTDDDPNAIGRAITSDANGDSTYKRRSRSLSQLDQVLPGDERRRSDEIRYWRQSYVSHDVSVGPLSPLSSNPSGPNDVEAENHDGRRSMGAVDSPAERVPPTPPQPFVFGSTGAMNEMAGMKITQAATLDERFGYLETRMSKLERIVDQLCHSVPGFKGPLEVTAPSGGRKRSGSSASAKAGVPTHHVTVSQPKYAYSNAVPPMIPAIYQTSSNNDDPRTSSRYTTSRRSVETTTDDNASSRMSYVDGHNYMDSLHPPSSSATHGAVSTVATSVQPPMPELLRPASELTVRPAASMPSLGSVSPNGEERSSNSAALLAQLDSERAARQLLEDQVRKLSERMNQLSKTMFAMVRDPVKSKSQERLRPQTANSRTNSTYLAPISVNNPGKPAIAPSSKAQSIFGRDMAGLGIASLSGSPTKEVNDDAFSDSFQTPREEMTPGLVEPFGDEFGASAGHGREVGDDEDDEKKAARTLSLSQLTMGKMI
ncbi:hypothetical protein N0V82_007945 [Gnomoniopsis sp. IMI 355080]|nr:hypothetical protein N0V82_007945 [Gnomoniopsis sp. IMI 355080]